MNAKKKGGWAKHAFVIGFFYLKKGNIGYEEVLYETLMLGGDTDTNACIVGGLIGALRGLKGIPQKSVEKLMNCNISMGKKGNRPKFL